MEAEPNGAAETALWPATAPGTSDTTWLAMNGARCDFMPIGPMPGPPPPCGMQKVLCRFMCDTSAPMSAGRVRPTCAFMLAPSMYTWPPLAWIRAQISLMPSSNTPWVDG
ncbi:hypothetical protein D3C72_1764160 [compost metagenome]